MDQIYASVRAGIGRNVRSAVHDRFLEPITMALVAEEEIEGLAPELDRHGLTSRQRRMVRLAAAPLREAAARLPPSNSRVPLFLGLPEARNERVSAKAMLSHVVEQAGMPVDTSASEVFPRGRAAALLALEAALRFVVQAEGLVALVGGVDTFLDLGLLAELDREGRILGSRVMDGFVPGEGAAFVLLRSSRRRRASGLAATVQVSGVGTAQDKGHRYSDEPARGEGLSRSMDHLLKGMSGPPAPIAGVYAGFNGESFGAKEWGVARLRHSEHFASLAPLEHPADCYGDVGAASGALLLGLAQAALARGSRSGPALVFASSDRQDRACALLDLLT
jgi:3-oxoacyl-[acyl-carrier-protein] synthase-1